MRIAIRIWNISMIIILVLLIMSTISQRISFQSELRSIVSDSLLQTSRVVQDNRYEITDNDEFMAEFEQNLLRNIKVSEKSEIKIHYLGVDVEHKVISVAVEQTSPYIFFPNRNFTVATKQSVILEENSEEIIWYDIRYHNISLNELPENSPHIHVNGTETILLNPSRDGSTFSHWEDVDGNKVEKISGEIEAGIDLYAVWE